MNDFKFLFKFLYIKFNEAFVSDQLFIQRQYKKITGHNLNLIKPTLFNEKLQWLKLNCRSDLQTKCVDKFLVREYVSENIGANILNKLYGVYSTFEDINFNNLPSSFVIKLNHGSGQNIIVKDKKKLDINKTQKKVNQFLKLNHYYNGREWPYKNVNPRIIIEKYLSDSNFEGQLIDYKVFCFNGIPKFIQVDFDRYNSHKRDFYDLDWNKLNYKFLYPNSNYILPKPQHLNFLIDYSKKLSKPFLFCRVDFYIVNDNIVFGEITFFPENGMGRFVPENLNYELGSLINLFPL